MNTQRTFLYWENFGMKYQDPSICKLVFSCQALSIVEADELCKKAGLNPFKYGCQVL